MKPLAKVAAIVLVADAFVWIVSVALMHWFG